MALRRIIIDIEDSEPTKQGRLRYEMRIQSSDIGEKVYNVPITASELHSRIEYAIEDVLDTL